MKSAESDRFSDSGVVLTTSRSAAGEGGGVKTVVGGADSSHLVHSGSGFTIIYIFFHFDKYVSLPGTRFEFQTYIFNRMFMFQMCLSGALGARLVKINLFDWASAPCEVRFHHP